MADSDRPYFLWDYDLTEDRVREILRGSNDFDRRWLLARILTNASYPDVWKYTNLKQVTSEFPHLKLRPFIKSAWQNAFRAWESYV